MDSINAKPMITHTKFKPVDGKRFEEIAKYFDKDNSGTLSHKEMVTASRAMTLIGGIFDNDEISNMGRAFAAIDSKIQAGDEYVDLDGDGELQIEYRGPWPAGTPDPREPVTNDGDADTADTNNAETDVAEGEVYPIWQPTTELSTIISRNNEKKLEMADLSKPRTSFDPVQRTLVRSVMGMFDQNNDGKAGIKEMTLASTLLNRLAKMLGGHELLENLANAFTRLVEEVQGDNRSVDQDGDKAITFDHMVTFPPGTAGLVAETEFGEMVSRNDPSSLEEADMYEYVTLPYPMPVGLVAETGGEGHDEAVG